jgi:hypothetical protein
VRLGTSVGGFFGGGSPLPVSAMGNLRITTSHTWIEGKPILLARLQRVNQVPASHTNSATILSTATEPVLSLTTQRR